MKKVILLFITFMFSTSIVLGEELPEEVNTYEVDLINCTSATTSWIKVNDEIKRVRLLAYDPDDGSLNNEIDKYACGLLKNASLITIEYDNVKSKDKYNRDSVWMYVDGKLLQELLIEKGYGQVNFVNEELGHLNELCEVQKKAILSSSGIWNYPGIEEKYCESGIDLKNPNKVEEKEVKEAKKYNVKDLYYLLVLSSGILVLTLTMKIKTRRI